MDILIKKYDREQTDLAYAIEEASRKQLDRIIGAMRHRKAYYILIVAKNDPLTGALKLTFSTSSICPPAMVGTVLYYRDNVNDKLTRMWVSPRDFPGGDAIEGTEQLDISDDANRLHLPIVY
jgi:hypothetical protein